MIGRLDPDEDVMDDSIIAQRKSSALMKALHDNIKNTIAELGWDCYDDVVVEVGGTSVYMIDGAGTKWAPKKGTRKYNKDAFIVIKNKSRDTFLLRRDLKIHQQQIINSNGTRVQRILITYPAKKDG